jgi:excisionase family DNA binding protein
VTDSPPLLHKVEDAARILGLGRSTVYLHIESGDIESVKIGRARRITQGALERFVARLESRAGAA